MNGQVQVVQNDRSSKDNEKPNVIELIKKNTYLFFKRLFDITISLILMPILFVVAIIVKIAYVLDKDYSSIFFVQKRIGKNGKEFNFYKFRSMVPNADEILAKLLKEDEELAEEYYLNKKLKHDPRITKMGNILRKTSLDELPQILNVFKGDMAFIGNRPYLPREKEDMGNFFEEIVSTKPGITGYWQVSGRSNVSFRNRLKLEREYSRNACLSLDIKIFFKTFKVVFGMIGAK